MESHDKQVSSRKRLKNVENDLPFACAQFPDLKKVALFRYFTVSRNSVSIICISYIRGPQKGAPFCGRNCAGLIFYRGYSRILADDRELSFPVHPNFRSGKNLICLREVFLCRKVKKTICGFHGRAVS